MAAFTFTCVFICLSLNSGLVIGLVISTPPFTDETTAEIQEEISTIIVTTIVDEDVRTQDTTNTPDEATFPPRTQTTTKLPDEDTFRSTRTQKTTKLPDNVTVRPTTRIAHEATTSVSKTKIPDEAISLVKAKSSALVISWNQDPCAKEYYIRYHPKHDKRQLHIKHVPATINETKLSELDSYTVYVIKIEVKTSSSYYIMGTVEMETLKARCSSSVETALIYIVCLFGAIIILLLIILCCIGRLKRRPNEKVEEARNGDVKLRNKGLEHHNPGYQQTEDEDGDKRTSHAYIYITPENTPVSSPMFVLPETKPDLKQ